MTDLNSEDMDPFDLAYELGDWTGANILHKELRVKLAAMEGENRRLLLLNAAVANENMALRNATPAHTPCPWSNPDHSGHGCEHDEPRMVEMERKRKP